MAAAPIDHKKEINGVLYLAAAVILAVAYYWPDSGSGWLGKFLLDTGRGFFGAAALALPVVFLYMAVDYLLEQHLKITRLRFTYVFLLLISAAALMHMITVDPASFRLLCQNEGNKPEAWQALLKLWQTGIRPDLLENSKTILTGGLLGGCLAAALQAIAGTVGSLVLLGALILSLVILLFNVSLSGAFGRTARAISHTRERVDQAVRSGVTQIQQNHAEQAADRKSYDLLLDEKAEKDVKTSAADNHEPASSDAAASGAESRPEIRKPTLLENLKRLFQPNEEEDGVRGLSAEDLTVPEFLQDGRPAGTASAADRSNPPTGQEEPGLRQQSAFDLRIKGPDWVLSPAETSGSQQKGLDYSMDLNPASADSKRQPYPAVSAEQPSVASAGASPDEHHENPAAEPAGSDRSGWTDRTEPVAGVVQPMILKTPHAESGMQIGLEIPYQAPSLQLLRDDPAPTVNRSNSQSVQALGQKLEHTLQSFGIQATVVHVTTGPTITRFELSPGPGVKVSRIVSLADDIALNLAALGVRIEAPIPGKSAIGIEIPNKETSPVLLRSLLESPEFQRSHSPLTAALGRDIQGSPVLCDLAKMPHLLIAGATGSGKSVCINAILMSILYRSSPEDVRLLMIDPKVVELSVYNGIPHLLAPVVTDPKKAANTLLWAVNEMVRRYGLFAEKTVRDINSYNAAAARGEGEYEKLPLILLVIDELSDLMATTPTEVEDAIARLTAMARAAGIHLIIATQRPSVDVITGVIKANIPSRIAFAVASQVDSRTILDMAGAEKLLGKGDMLYYPQSSAKPIRGQGAFVTDSEVERVLTAIKAQHTAEYDQAITDAIMTAPPSGSREKDSSEQQDELLPQALGIVVEAGYASVSLLQRRMNVGYPRAARLIDRMQEMGYVGPFEGSKPRKVLITAAQFLELKAKEDH
ncbi:MAG: DNA translocase FtsK [Clostridiaceae bacterium]|nr:DNA translocase FtsK [Clostridiaceae bacterium]